MSTKIQQNPTQNHSLNPQPEPSPQIPIKVWFADPKYKISQYPNQNEHPSQLYANKYWPAMSSIKVPGLERVKDVLKSHQFYFRSNAQSAQPLKVCRKSNNQQLLYWIKIGNIETKLNIFKFSAKSNIYTPQYIAKGQFGKISQFQYKGKKYALKSINIRLDSPQALFNAMQEVFIIKMCSFLKIGPHFSQLYGYDSILFEDCLQFVMQFCQTDAYPQQNIDQQLQNKNLLKSLKILHSLNICHCDIKPDNIGWSNIYNKFVFLDFGFSKFVYQPIGYKTLCSFKGTFKYCSEEMKKLYLLRNKTYVDLYYNDLCCLQKSMLQVEKSVERQEAFYEPLIYPDEKSQSIEISSEDKDNISFTLQDKSNKLSAQNSENNNAHIVSFYQLKYHISHEDWYTIIDLSNQQNILVYTFRRILFQATQKFPQHSPSYEKISLIYNKYLQHCNHYESTTNFINKFDAILCDYLVRTSCQRTEMSHREKLLEIVQSEDCFRHVQEYWGTATWMEEIFFYLDGGDDLTTRTLSKNKHNLLNALYEYIQENIPSQTLPLRSALDLQVKKLNLTQSPPSIASILHTVLLTFFHYFSYLENVELLQLLLPYFIIFRDQHNLKQMQQCILVHYWTTCGPRGYALKCLEFFVGVKLAEIQGIHLLGNVQRVIMEIEQTRKNKQTQGTVQKSEQEAQALLLFYKRTATIMHLIIYIESGSIHTISKPFARDQILLYANDYIKNYPELYANLVSLPSLCYKLRSQQEIIKALDKIKGLSFKKRYFHVCIGQREHILVSENAGNHEDYLHNNFIKYYFPFQRFLSIEEQKVLSEQQKQYSPDFNFNASKMQHYLQIRLLSTFNLTIQQITTIMNCIEYISDQYVNQFFHSYVDGLQLGAVYDLNGLLQLLEHFDSLLRALMPIDHRNTEKIREIKTFVAEKAKIVVEWSRYFVQQCRDRETCDLADLNLIQQIHTIESLILLALNKPNEAAKQFIQIFKKIKKPCTAFFFLCELHHYEKTLTPEIKRNIEDVISETEFLSQQNIETTSHLLTTPLMCRVIVEAKLKSHKFEQSYVDMLKCMMLFNKNSCFYLSNQIMPIIVCFLMGCAPHHFVLIYVDILQRFKLPHMCTYPSIAVLLFQLLTWSANELVKDRVAKQMLRKGFIYCAFGFHHIITNGLISGKLFLDMKARQFLGVKNISVAKFKRFLLHDEKKIKTDIKKYMRKIKPSTRNQILTKLHYMFNRIAICNQTNLQDQIV